MMALSHIGFCEELMTFCVLDGVEDTRAASKMRKMHHVGQLRDCMAKAVEGYLWWEFDLSMIKLFCPVTVRSRSVLCIAHVIPFSMAFALNNETVWTLNYHGFFNTIIRICIVNRGEASVRSPSLCCYATASAGLIRRSFLLSLPPSIRQYCNRSIMAYYWKMKWEKG